MVLLCYDLLDTSELRRVFKSDHTRNYSKDRSSGPDVTAHGSHGERAARVKAREALKKRLRESSSEEDENDESHGGEEEEEYESHDSSQGESEEEFISNRQTSGRRRKRNKRLY